MTNPTVRISLEVSSWFSSIHGTQVFRGWVYVDRLDESGELDLGPEGGFASGAGRTCLNDTAARGDAIELARRIYRALRLVGTEVELLGVDADALS